VLCNRTMNVGPCPICFGDNGMVGCSNRRCDVLLCVECARAYFTHSLTDKMIPKCTNCSTVFFQSDLNRYPDLLLLYNKCCMKELSSTNNDATRKTFEIMERINKIRNEREVFIHTKLPVAVQYTAQIIMPSALKKIDKQMVARIHEQSNRSRRTCMNLMCNGSLDDNFVCLTCGTRFCKECETLLQSGHMCRPEDVESVKEVNQMVRCPNCMLPVIKSDGCNAMRCSNCNENFMYDSGKKGGGGNSHNASVSVKTKVLLSNTYREQLTRSNMLNDIINLEHLQPTAHNPQKLNELLVQGFRTNFQDNTPLEQAIAMEYEAYTKRKLKVQAYQRSMIEIEQLIIRDQLTLAVIQEAMRVVRGR
jgi:hypothetical protein